MRPAILLLGLLAAAGCRATDPAYRTSEGKEVRVLDPVPYRIGVAPVESGGWLDGQAKEGEPYWFTLDDLGLQALLVALMDPEPAAAEAYRLETQRAANHVFPLEARELPLALEEAQRRGADLIVVPRLVEPPRLVFGERVRTLPSLAWWLGTWVGGLHVQDKRYEARMTVDFDVLNAHDGTTLDTFTAASETMDLTLWERDGRKLGSGAALSLLVPPQLARDRRARVSAVLSLFVGARLGARFTGYLKEDFTRRERSLLGAVRAIHPRNGASVGDVLSLRAEVIAEQPITHVALYRNGSREPLFEIREDGPDPGALDRARQAAGRYFRVSLAGGGGPDRGDPVRIPLAAGRNEVRLEYAVLGRYASRTLVYHNTAP